MTTRVVGIGLNKTATKSLAHCMEALGYRNKSYCLDAFSLYRQKNWPALFDIMDNYTSFEDWPWPLMYREIEQHYPDARFILTTRASPVIWYQSLCKMAVRMGPLNQFEKHIYGYSMPQGRRAEHLQYYNRHNAEVREYFADKPGKLLEVCFDHGVQMSTLCTFLDAPQTDFQVPHENRGEPVYDGDSLWRAHGARLVYQSRWYTRLYAGKIRNRVNRLLG